MGFPWAGGACPTSLMAASGGCPSHWSRSGLQAVASSTALAWTDSSPRVRRRGYALSTAARLPSAGKLVLPAQRGRAERALADATAPRRSDTSLGDGPEPYYRRGPKVLARARTPRTTSTSLSPPTETTTDARRDFPALPLLLVHALPDDELPIRDRGTDQRDLDGRADGSPVRISHIRRRHGEVPRERRSPSVRRLAATTRRSRGYP